jgi:amino acid transporter
MSNWEREDAAPVPALITQGVLALALIFFVGTTEGRGSINWVLDRTATTVQAEGDKVVRGGHYLPPMEWEDSWKAKLDTGAGEKVTDLAKGGFDTLLTCTAPVFWVFFLLTGLSLFALRQKDANIERPFRVPFYPTLPLIFCASCGYMLYSSIDYALSRNWKGGVFLLGLLPLLIGIPLYHLSGLLGDNARQENGPETNG